ncbi:MULTISPECIES: hypothetical protein [Pseudomonas]|uniref:hypothetical protein n=1 Tax=Pseudomonas TaxID=286 RepID=UPI000F01CB0B|nr:MULTISPECIES: hypothetical protein [Pseudomonas]MBD8615579.1 hypothetical protein [Pseudomonas putida]MBD8681769.1 hypothetical protein [Pseudomonas sp. CFBP 13719]
MKSFPNQLKQALSAVRTEGGMTVGTSDLIEAIRVDLHMDYQQIAKVGQVSVAGLKRWRENNKGEHPRVEVLVSWAQNRLDAETGDLKSLTPADALRKCSIGDIEAHLTTALKKLLGEDSVASVSISDLKPSEDGQVFMSLRLQ